MLTTYQPKEPYVVDDLEDIVEHHRVLQTEGLAVSHEPGPKGGDEEQVAADEGHHGVRAGHQPVGVHFFD